MIALPAILAMKLVEELALSAQTCRSLIMQSGVPGVVLMSLNATASFTLW